MMLSKCVYLSILALLYVESFVFPNNSNITTGNTTGRLLPNLPINFTLNSTVNSSTTPDPFLSPAPPPNTSPRPMAVPPMRKLHCFLDEKFMSEVLLMYTIGIRNRDNFFKITGLEGNFNFNFFNIMPSDDDDDYDQIAGILNGDPSTTPSYNSTNLANSTGNSSMVFWNSTVSSSSSNSSSYPFLTPNPRTRLHHSVALDSRQRFHFLAHRNGFRYYKVNWEDYKRRNLDEEPFGGRRFMQFFWNFSGPYHCHFNVVRNSPFCVSIEKKQLTLYYFNSQNSSLPPKDTRINLPNYVRLDALISYADSKGTDYVLFHHKGQWIYRFTYQDWFSNQNMFFKVFHLKTPGGPYFFQDFMYADEHGLITEYKDHQGRYRYYYSVFSEASGLTTYCVHDKYIDGSLMMLGRKRPPPAKGITAELREVLGVDLRESVEFPTTLRILFYCTCIYLMVFLTTQLIPVRKVRLSRELRRLEKEVQRFAPVIEVIVGKVHVFMQNMKVDKKKE